MRRVSHSIFLLSFVMFAALLPTHAEDLSKQVKQAIERSTLDQPGTHPFHLRAEFAPSFERDANSHRNGYIEIWWRSPDHWRREVQGPGYHQIEIVDGEHIWQKSDGDYFPEWLRELSNAIVHPLPLPMNVLLERVKTGEVRQMHLPHRDGSGQITSITQTNIDWDPVDSYSDQQSNGKGDLALLDGSLFYTNGPGFGGLYENFERFDGHLIARTVKAGIPEVTAKISILEELNATPDGFFDASASGGDTNPIQTIVVSEEDLRKQLIEEPAFAWPPLKDGPLEGVAWTEVVIDRTGKIREMIDPIADNPGVKEAAEKGFREMQFHPVMLNGVPVQATARLSEKFKTTRPAGMETFDSARNYFERGRELNCLGTGATAPYRLRAQFHLTDKDGAIKTGTYDDTWLSPTQWKREAWFESSHLVRSRVGDKYFRDSDGPQVGLLQLVFEIVEPIPAADTMTESDWRIKRDTVFGANAIRVMRGPEGPNGSVDLVQSNAYWFDDAGYLLKSLAHGLVYLPKNTTLYAGVRTPSEIDVLKDGEVVLTWSQIELAPPDVSAAKTFKLKGHEWQRAFTAETR